MSPQNIISIGKKFIGGKHPCLIIAEAGVNHNKSLKLARQLIDAAKKAGVDAIKFQTFKPEDLVTKEGRMAEYQRINIGKEASQLEMLKKVALNYGDFIKLKKYCVQKKIMFLSTAHTQDAFEFLADLVPAYKIASGDLVNIPFLEKVAQKMKPIILSTGMSSLNEVSQAVKVIRKKNSQLILLHCTTNYPCDKKDVNLKAIETLKKEFNLPVGYSDHTQGIIIPITAVALGACVIEKHFTLSKNLPGPDHKASLEPNELKEMVEGIRDIEKALGSGCKRPTLKEKAISNAVRKSIVAKTNIKKGVMITGELLEIKRPGTGIPSNKLNIVIGRKAKKNILKDSLIKWDYIE